VVATEAPSRTDQGQVPSLCQDRFRESRRSQTKGPTDDHFRRDREMVSAAGRAQEELSPTRRKVNAAGRDESPPKRALVVFRSRSRPPREDGTRQADCGSARCCYRAAFPVENPPSAWSLYTYSTLCVFRHGASIPEPWALRPPDRRRRSPRGHAIEETPGCRPQPPRAARRGAELTSEAYEERARWGTKMR
jgi:hypothetical protein